MFFFSPSVNLVLGDRFVNGLSRERLEERVKGPVLNGQKRPEMEWDVCKSSVQMYCSKGKIADR